ncbi:MAG: asparagine synthase (glutamine-hydrolyzing), partial [Flavobacteriales bacterium]|nr:asparagine synthase (glutamine-hydrolyzing) [Flavobacteriales bacterium]
MCGIVGVLNNKRDIEQGRLRSIVDVMIDKIKHRGPDANGTIVSNYGVLGHARLSIIDLENGHQPMYSADGRYVLVFNGEIYNYIELRIELIQKGITFSTFSDTEVLLNALIFYGEGAINKLNGMFAFCFLDTQSGDWIICRDHFGIKPLYYSVVDDQLYFASEIKSFTVVPGFLSKVNRKGMDQYFTFQFCLGNETLFDGVKKVEPGFFLSGHASTIKRVKRYWSADYQSDTAHTEDYFLEKLQFFLKDSARLQIRSDVPLGAYLSGGLDSSIVSTLAAETLKDKLPLFTGRFAEGAEYEETYYAKEVCNHLRGEMHEITPTAKDFVDNLPYIMSIMDEPVAGPGVFPQYMVSKEASKYVKVILGGQGGDEIFGGYARYLVGYFEQALKANIMGDDDTGDEIELSSLISNLPLLKQYKPMLANFWKEGLFESIDKRYFRLIDRSPDLQDILTTDARDNFDKKSV